LENIESEYDSHWHICKGQVDMKKALDFVGDNHMVTVETEKNNDSSLGDFEEDVVSLHARGGKCVVSIVEMDEKHIYNSYLWIKNAELRKLFLMQNEPSFANHLLYLKKLKHDATQRVFAITFADIHVGNCGIKYIDTVALSAEIWIYLGKKEFRNLGLGRMAISCLLDFCKKELFLKKIIVHVADFNDAALRLYRSSGFSSLEPETDAMWKRQDCKVIRMELNL
jgi:RimJ/RimL family protein N-acetyltransferase